jgi:hypothetical protein
LRLGLALLTPSFLLNSRSDSDTSKDTVLPDFHRLVNYPDHLIKGRVLSVDGSCKGSSAGNNPNALSGKKRCVMCGQLRISATFVRAKRSGGSKQATDNAALDDPSQGAVQNNGGSSHIIPRQNKGVCTACDVTVWVALELDGLEIKWCKGCKNFRPWSAFGSKGSATKCVRCRDRQKEKYALQKSVNRCRNGTESAGEACTSAEAVDMHNCNLDVVAAKGLRNLMNAK